MLMRSQLTIPMQQYAMQQCTVYVLIAMQLVSECRAGGDEAHQHSE